MTEIYLKHISSVCYQTNAAVPGTNRYSLPFQTRTVHVYRPHTELTITNRGWLTTTQQYIYIFELTSAVATRPNNYIRRSSITIIVASATGERNAICCRSHIHYRVARAVCRAHYTTNYNYRRHVRTIWLVLTHQDLSDCSITHRSDQLTVRSVVV